MQNKFLPIGSVVLLKDGEKSLVICGYCAKPGEDGSLYDYIGVMYPEGIRSSKEFIFFNHSDLEKVLYTGYESNEFLKLNSDMIDKFGGDSESN